MRLWTVKVVVCDVGWGSSLKTTIRSCFIFDQAGNMARSFVYLHNRITQTNSHSNNLLLCYGFVQVNHSFATTQKADKPNENEKKKKNEIKKNKNKIKNKNEKKKRKEENRNEEEKDKKK